MTRFLPGVVNKIVWHNVDSEVSLDQHSLDPTTDTIIKKESKASERAQSRANAANAWTVHSAA